MPVIKKSPKEGYCVIPNNVLRSKQLSLKDKGLLCYLLSLPDDWKFSIEGLLYCLPQDGRQSIGKSLNRLEHAGYLVRKQERGEKGAFSGNTWVVSGAKLTEAEIKKALGAEADPPPPGGEDFDVFWEAYPKKVGKKAARKAFDKLRGVPVETLLRALEEQKKSSQWTEDKGKYIPEPSKWLNQERWEDEVVSGGGSGDPFMETMQKIYQEETEVEGNDEQKGHYAGVGNPENGLSVGLPGHEPG